jgi:hypothetical protein
LDPCSDNIYQADLMSTVARTLLVFKACSVTLTYDIINYSGRLIPQSLYRKEKFCFPRKGLGSMMSKKVTFTTRSSSEDGSSDQGKACTSSYS